MATQFENKSLLTRTKSMLKVDFKRMFTMPLIYIMAGVCFAMPILILVMTTMMGAAEPTAQATANAAGAEAAIDGFTNVWQIIATESGSAMGMGLTSMCNINLTYFLAAVLVCIFVADDFRGGYAKNIFTVRAGKLDYVISKTAVSFVGGVIMLVCFFVGAMIGGAIAGLPFDTGAAGAGGVVACLISKIFLMAVFVAIYLLLSVVGKQRLWLSILGSFAAGMLLFTMIPMITPLDASALNVVLCLAGGAAFGAGLGAVSNIILQKTSLV